MKQIAYADVFYFKWIFHDYSDADCKKILAGLHQVMKRNAMIVVICDTLYPQTRNQWEYYTTLDLLMAVLLNGKERTEAEWKQLFCSGEGYSFQLVSIVPCNEQQKQWGLGLITLKKRLICSSILYN